MSETGNTTQKKLNSSRTATSDTGAKYEISVATLVAAIISNNDKIEKYHVFRELKEAYPFDDVVVKVFFKGENTPYAFAMQLKHIGKGETLDVEKYLMGYNKISKAGGFKTIGNIDIANIHFCYFCVNKVNISDSYTLHQHNPTRDSWRSALSFPKCHKLALNTDSTETNKDFLNNFHLYLHQPDNNKIKKNIKTFCRIEDVSGILNFIDRYFEKEVLWKRGLQKEVFETELLRIRLSGHIIEPTDIIQLNDLQSAVWHKITLQHNVTIVAAEMNIEKSLYGSCAQALNRLLNNRFNWDTYKTNPLDSIIESEFKKLFAKGRVGHWIDPPTTLKSLIVELWKCGEIPLILRSDDNLPVLKDYAHLSKSYIIVTENVDTKREECNSYQLSVFTHVSDIKREDLKDELLKGILVSLQGRKPIRLLNIIDRHQELVKTLSCFDIIHLMKSRTAYLSKECLDGDHNLLFLIEDPNSTAEYNINSISSVGSNIAIRCRAEDIAKYRKQIEGNPNFRNYEIYHCVTSSRHENLSVQEENKSLLGDFFVDQDGEAVYVLGVEPLPIVGPTLRTIQPRYILRYLCNAVVSESLFDSKTKGICFFSGNFSYLKKNVRQYLIEAPDDIKFDNKNTFIRVKDEDADKHWQTASDLKCPLLHIRVESTGMNLRRYKDWVGLSEHITYNGQKISEENILTEVTSGITILTGEPGIGKSSLLQSIFKNHAMEKYVLFYNLVDYGRFIEKKQLVPTNISLDFLLERSFNKRYKEFLSTLFKKKDRALILLDSFDEILPAYKKTVLQFIRNLAASNVQIIIASRTIANHILMGNFETRILKVDSLRTDDYKEYVKSCRINDKILTTIQDESVQNPLYLNLLKTISENNVNLKHFSKLHLFQNVIEIKMDQYFQRYFSIHLITNKEYHLKPVRELHFQLALIRILGTDIVKELLQLENKSELTHELKIGMVLSINEDGYPIFVHETFAEYLAADWVIRNITKESGKKIYQEIRKQKKLYVLNIFCEYLELHRAVLTLNEQQIEEICANDRSQLERTDALGRMAIHIAAAHQPNPLWSALDIIICNMRKHKLSLTQSDVTMQWDWVQHSYQINIIESMMHADISTTVWEAYINCVAQKAQNDRNYINLFSDYEITKIYEVAIRSNSIEMMRDLLFIEDLKHNGVSKVLEVDTLYLRNIRKFTALHVACIYGNVEAVREFIKHRNINVVDEFGCTPLFYSVINPPEVSALMTEILLENGSTIDTKNYYRETVLDIAVLSGNAHIMKLLLQKYISIKNSRKYMLELVFLIIENVNSAGSASRGPKYVCNKGHLEIIELLLEEGVDVNGRNAAGETPLILASKRAKLDFVRILLQKRANINGVATNGKTPLMFASQEGHLDIVKILLKKGAKVNGATESGETPLMFASQRGELDIVRLLLEKGANINPVTTDGKTPLMLASEEGHLDIVKILLKNSADVNGATKNGETPLMFASQRGELDIIRLLLQKGANINGVTTNGKTPLMLASKKGHLDIIRLLLEKGANINAVTTDGKTPLMFASEEGHLDIVKVLLKSSADVNSATKNGETLLMFASQKGHLDIIRLLLEKDANINAVTTDDKTPLMLASEEDHLDIVEILLEKGAYVNGVTTVGKTPLMYASREGNLDIVKMLLEAGANVNGATIDGKTPLMFASERYNSDIVELLLEKGADVNGATTDGKTPLIYASQRGNLDIVKILLEKGADINGATTDGKTPLIYASQGGNLEIVKILLEKSANINGATTDHKTPLMFASQCDELDIVKILLEKRANINNLTTDGKTALMYASQEGNLDIVKILLEEGANINGTTTDGKTPLMFASQEGNLDIVKILLEEGADINGTTTDGKTPLMFASQEGNLDIVKILLEEGADINSTTTDGKTSLMYASQYDELDIVKILLEKDANINCVTTDGKTPLMFALQEGNLDIVKILLEKDADVMGATTDGKTPLMFASQHD